VRRGAPSGRRGRRRFRRCIDLLAVDGERRAAGDHDIELFVVPGARARLVVLLDDELAGVRRVTR
jgi:hypothetical protein